jgi:hypothetical protein
LENLLNSKRTELAQLQKKNQKQWNLIHSSERRAVSEELFEREAYRDPEFAEEDMRLNLNRENNQRNRLFRTQRRSPGRIVMENYQPGFPEDFWSGKYSYKDL